ncbi:MAG: hypothetical protein LBQ24_00735 [Candidatus Peribacteria bacterium]|nr:hypothetical protein [Candidatus Peribacteria bacterium]
MNIRINNDIKNAVIKYPIFQSEYFLYFHKSSCFCKNKSFISLKYHLKVYIKYSKNE